MKKHKMKELLAAAALLLEQIELTENVSMAGTKKINEFLDKVENVD